MHPLYAISGISGSGKSTLGKILEERIPNICGIEQDDYFLGKLPRITLSNGQTAYNWDSLEAIDPEFSNIIREKLLTSPVLVYGFALCREMLPVIPTVHIHLVTANNPHDLEERCCAARLQAKDIKDIERDRLRVREYVIPFYHEMVRKSDITYLLDVYNFKGKRISLNTLKDIALSIIIGRKRNDYYIMHVCEPYHSLIKSGIKPVEGRKISPKWENLKYGDIILMMCENCTSFGVKVTGIHHYLPNTGDPLTAYLLGETLERTLPGITDIETARNIYLQWSTEEEIKSMGMMGIQVQVI